MMMLQNFIPVYQHGEYSFIFIISFHHTVSSSTTALSPENGLLLVLVRLRLALLMEDLASRFNVSLCVASRTLKNIYK